MTITPHITTARKLLTSAWTADVDRLERGIRRLIGTRPVIGDCRVVFFELSCDKHLHVNVTHTHQMKAPVGWAGPARMDAGFVHNRRFGGTPPGQLLRAVGDMVFAARA